MSFTQTQTPPPPGAASGLWMSLEQIQNIALWLFIFSGWLVIIEPAPYELLFVVTLLLFIPRGLTATALIAPLIAFIAFYNVGGFFSAMQVVEPQGKAFKFVIISTYMGVTAIFFAMAATQNPLRISRIMRNAWILAAVIASINGLIGYFDVAGMGDAWAPIQRAQGTFKDPNVLSTFLVAPFVLLVQGFMLGTQRRPFLSAIALLIISAGLFFAFSRGAWVVSIGSVILIAGLTFITTPSAALRSRIILITIAGVLALAALLAILLSIPSIRAMFQERFALIQPYDGGETGRFANQLRSLPLLMARPNGFGPYGFAAMFTEDPHNVYINAFSAYGWLGGLSYILLILSTLYAGLRSVFTETPWRHYAIAFYAPLVMLILQGLQIDTDHWRHFYILLGMTWGLFAASEMYRLRNGAWGDGAQDAGEEFG